MKKNYLLPLCVSALSFVFAQNARAQVKKGDVLLGGNVSFYTNTNDATASTPKTKTTSVSFSPSIGKAVKDNLVVGLNLLYGHASQTINNGPITENKQDHYGAGVFARRYKYLGSGFAAFIQADLNFLYDKQKMITPSIFSVSEIKSTSINAGFEPGITYAISKRVQLETGFQNLVSAAYTHNKSNGYLTTSPNDKSSSTSHAFSINTSLSQALENFIVGVRFLI